MYEQNICTNATILGWTKKNDVRISSWQWKRKIRLECAAIDASIIFAWISMCVLCQAENYIRHLKGISPVLLIKSDVIWSLCLVSEVDEFGFSLWVLIERILNVKVRFEAGVGWFDFNGSWSASGTNHTNCVNLQ